MPTQTNIFSWDYIIDEDESLTIYQVNCHVDFKDLLSIFASSTLYPKIFFNYQDEKHLLAGLGSCRSWSHIPKILLKHSALDDEPLWFLSTHFNKDTHAHCFIPHILLKQAYDEDISVLIHFDHEPEENEIEKALSLLKSSAFIPSKSPNYEAIARIDTPQQSQWHEMIKKLTSSFDATLQKVVLSRLVIWRCKEAIDPYHILQSLSQNGQGVVVFGYFPKEAQGFVGASPEHLYVRDHHVVKTEALAGTRLRSATYEEDTLLEKELLASSKDLHEFHIVRLWIENKLKLLCDHYKQSPIHVKKNHLLQHLHSCFEGSLLNSIDDQTIISTLHPTPALCGEPQEAAYFWINKHEPFERNHYGAPIGFISSSRANILVGIRSAWIYPHSIEAFSGVGIVKNSDSLKEWEELESKIAQFKQFFHAEATQ